MRVLFPLHGFICWNGGLDFVRLVTTALAQPAVADEIDLHFALPETSLSGLVMPALLRRWRSLRAGSSSATGGASALRETASLITADHPVITCPDNSTGILQAANVIDADIVFPTMLPLEESPRRRIGYLFDFQHRHLPNLFSSRTLKNRDKQFLRIASNTDGIVVNSQMVARDVAHFLHVHPERILALPFTPYTQPWRLDVDPLDAQRRYGIRGPFLLVCNHFWVHKDHTTALRAFAMLKRLPAYADLQLVLTGDPIDHRDPQHYGRLHALVKSLGIADSTHFLGLIAKRDQLALLQGCRVLLQPTLFEGGPGGGSVCEAIGLGVPAVISDIAINREVDCGQVSFFQAGSPQDLAMKTSVMLADPPNRPSRAQLLAQSDARLEHLATAIADYLARFAAGSSS